MKASENNFDFLRFLLASFVIITHSYALLGTPENDLLMQISGGQVRFSTLAVRGFFVISGYLIFLSLERSSSVWNFLKKRVLRIMPGLVAMTFVVILFSAFFLTKESVTAFLFSRETFVYAAKNILMFFGINPPLHDVFVSNPVPAITNGSLWTLSYEALFYLILAGFFFVKRSWRMPVFVGLWISLYVARLWWTPSLVLFPYTSFEAYHLIDFGLYFLAGAILSHFVERMKSNFGIIFCGALLVMILAGAVHLYGALQYIALPVAVISLAWISLPPLNRWGNFGDFSYGIYIYAFFVQQVLVYFFPSMSLGLFMTLSFVGSWACGILSWYLVERWTIRSRSQLQKSV
ncbi:MAG: acyltransferase [Patescibacteria group bacterium]